MDPSGELERVYREEAPKLWRAIVAYAGDREVANDAVAEAFAQALRRGTDVHSPRAWVWRAAFRIAAGELKSRRAPPIVGGGASDPDETALDLRRALAELSPKQRGAVLLHHYAGFPVKDVARILGSTGPAVRVHLSRGRARLRELLEVRDE